MTERVAFLDPEGRSQNATLVVVVVISSLKLPKVLIFPTDLPSWIFVCPMQCTALDRI